MRDSHPAFSVVIPLYNKAAYVERCLRSVRAQTLTDYEVIVVDDGSTDGGSEVARRFLRPGDRLVCQDNAGVSAARNKGIREARADLVAFLDADDEWLPHFLATIGDLRESWPEAALYSTAFDQVYGDRRRAAPIPKLCASQVERYDAAALVDHWLRGLYPIWSSATVAVKGAIVDVGGFPVGLHSSEDLDTWFRIALHHSVVWSPLVSALYHQASDRGRLTRADIKGDSPWSSRLEAYVEDRSIPAPIRARLPELISRRRLYAVQTNLAYGRPQEARELLSQCRGHLGRTAEYRRLKIVSAMPVPALRILIWTRRFLRSVMAGAARGVSGCIA